MTYSVITMCNDGRISMENRYENIESNLPHWWEELKEFEKEEYDESYER